MNLKFKKKLDLYLGTMLILGMRPFVRLLGMVLKRDHSLGHGNICFVKMLGGGSLVIAMPALLGIRKRYPSSKMNLITTKAVAPFAMSLGLFDHISVIDDQNFPKMLWSTLSAIFVNFRVGTLVDLEVYSRLTTVLSTLTCARNRLGFYQESIYWRRLMYTHLVFFNNQSPVYEFYDAICKYLGGVPAEREECAKYVERHIASANEVNSNEEFVIIACGCSDLAKERELNPEQWYKVFQTYHQRLSERALIFLGGTGDWHLAERIILTLSSNGVPNKMVNLCGKLKLKESLQTLRRADLFLGVDSGLGHYARLLLVPTISFWGPTNPLSLLRPFKELNEIQNYRKILCSPCVHTTETPPCQGRNMCMSGLFASKGNESAADPKVVLEPFDLVA